MISDNNHITYSAEDIQRYWNGQLSPQEMHAMEKAALDDPFLADAMEGIGIALQEHDEKEVNAPLAELHQQLQTRTGPQKRRAIVRGFRWYQVAAAALVLVTVGYWILSSSESKSDLNTVAANERTDTPAASKTAPAEKSSAPATTDSQAMDTVSNVVAPELRLKKDDEPGLREFKTSTPAGKRDSQYISQKPVLPAATPELNKKKQDVSVVLSRSSIPAGNISDSSFKGETEVVKVQKEFTDLDKLAERRQRADEPKLQNVVSGVVTDNRNNPLPNVFIRLDDKTNAQAFNTDRSNTYTTDRLGNFRIPIADSVVNVSVSLPGYFTQNFQLRSTHNGAGALADNQIRMEPASKEQLDEAVAQGYGKKLSSKAKGITVQKATEQNAQPTYGWLTYEQYLEKNKRVPTSNPDLKGEVAISFAVNRKGELSDFKVEKSLSPDHDSEAIRLIRVGPTWELKKGRKSRVTVIVRY